MMGVSTFRAARRKRARRPRTYVALGVLALALMPAAASAQTHTTDDPRVGLAFGLTNPGVAADGVALTAHVNKAPGFFDPAAAGSIAFANSDLAIKGTTAFVGNFNGWQAYNISNPAAPTLITQVVCPGGQGDPSVWGNLLFISVEETRARTDCGTQGTVGAVDPARFRGVRIFDISNLAAPVQVAAVQTCRGSHTHTLVPDPNDANAIYIYNSGTSSVRSGAELAGCENAALTTSPVTSGNPTQWRIDIIRVPLGAPQNAAIVNQPRIFTDPATGAFNGLQNTQSGTLHPSGTPYSPLPNTNTCHDMTAFPEVGLLAGACQGNGILLDISDPAHPVRLDAVSDPNFSYWHSATFNNDGTKVIFTDEWGGGTSPRCRITDQLSWGANAIFDINAANKMVFKSYWKMPAVQTDQENCVAHNGNIVPVPGRDIFSQAWYQAGHTLLDFTDSAHPKEIGYYDRGRISETGILFGTRRAARRPLVDVLLQRPHVRHRDRTWVRRVRIHADRRPLGERDPGGVGAAALAAERAAPVADRPRSELRGRPFLPRPAGSGGSDRRPDARAGGEAPRRRGSSDPGQQGKGSADGRMGEAQRRAVRRPEAGHPGSGRHVLGPIPPGTTRGAPAGAPLTFRRLALPAAPLVERDRAGHRDVQRFGALAQRNPHLQVAVCN